MNRHTLDHHGIGEWPQRSGGGTTANPCDANLVAIMAGLGAALVLSFFDIPNDVATAVDR